MEYLGIIAESITHEGASGDLVQSYLARPLGPGPFPGVVIAHHLLGWDESNRELARNLAAVGYVTVCPNLFWREAPGATPEDGYAIIRSQGGQSDAQVIADLDGAVKYLRGLPYASGRVGLIGFCSGGRQTYLAACKLDVDAAVDCHGGRVVASKEELSELQPVAPIDYTKDMRAPFLGLFGDEDANPDPAQVAIIRSELEKYNKTFEIHSYAGAGHSFTDPHRPSYRPEAWNDAWEKLLAFYGKYLA